MVYFVGAGSGAPDLITVRGARLLNQADQIIYAGSLVNPELLDYKKESAVVYDSAKMTLEEVVEKIQEAESTGKIVRVIRQKQQISKVQGCWQMSRFNRQ